MERLKILFQAQNVHFKDMGKSWELHAYIHTNFIDRSQEGSCESIIVLNILMYKFKANWKPGEN